METKTFNAGADFNVKFINPEAVVAGLDFKPGMKVADFGCGTGYFTFPVAQKVGNDGVVYALDILREKLETIDSQAKLLGVNNIIVRRVNLEQPGGSKIAKESMDWVILVNMLFQNKDKEIIINEAKRVLKPKGQILLIEWDTADYSMGPDRRIRVDKDNLLKILNKNNLGVIREMEISHFHYGLILIK